MEITNQKGVKIGIISAIANAILACTAFIGLILAIIEFVESRSKVLGIGETSLIIILISATFIYVIILMKRWAER